MPEAGKIRIIVNGAGGRMGGILCRLIRNSDDFELACACSRRDGYRELWEAGEADALIDFSSHLAAGETARFAADRKLPLIAAVTGYTPEEKRLIEGAGESVPVLIAPNLSLGIAILKAVTKSLAKRLPGAEIEIVECHHHLKADVPSGTALSLAEGVKEARPGANITVGRSEPGRRAPEDVGIHSLRYGSEPGTHAVLFSCPGETLTFSHRALDPALFALGALEAAKFIVNKPAGLYSMEDMVTI